MAPISEICASISHTKQFQSHHVICASQTWYPAHFRHLPPAFLSLSLSPSLPVRFMTPDWP
ncbi:hypothetical protein CGRA01v4_10617 [Colletotrichum graminicola]|nr:hypothetical protein CGRA01v4_10617 [Colletotrichum graminicola]